MRALCDRGIRTLGARLAAGGQLRHFRLHFLQRRLGHPRSQKADGLLLQRWFFLGHAGLQITPDIPNQGTGLGLSAEYDRRTLFLAAVEQALQRRGVQPAFPLAGRVAAIAIRLQYRLDVVKIRQCGRRGGLDSRLGRLVCRWDAFLAGRMGRRMLRLGGRPSPRMAIGLHIDRGRAEAVLVDQASTLVADLNDPKQRGQRPHRSRSGREPTSPAVRNTAHGHEQTGDYAEDPHFFRQGFVQVNILPDNFGQFRRQVFPDGLAGLHGELS